jgi:hypothetical protein
MDNCPSVIQIALFIEGKLTKEETELVKNHLLTCTECSFIYQTQLEINILENDNQLPSISNTDIERAKNLLSNKESIKGESRIPSARRVISEEQKEGHSGIEDLLGFSAITGALNLIHDAFSSINHVPAFGGDNHLSESEIPSHEGVRNDDHESSIYIEQQNNAELTKENLIMEDPIEENSQHAPTEIGLPAMDGTSPSVQQGYDDTCAIRSQELVLRDFGIPVTEDSLREQAMNHGWYTPGGGSTQESVGNLLEMYGVDVHKYDQANIFNLTSELAQGHKVIVGVDANELWYNGPLTHLQDAVGDQQANHALLVSGIDTSDPDHVQVILTDPGSGDVAKAYPIEQFVDSWKDSNCFMVATNDPIPNFNTEMQHFDYEAGHLDHVGELSWSDLDHASQSFYDVPVDQHITDDFSNTVSGEIDSQHFFETIDEFKQDVTHHSSIDSSDPLHTDQSTDHQDHLIDHSTDPTHQEHFSTEHDILHTDPTDTHNLDLNHDLNHDGMHDASNYESFHDPLENHSGYDQFGEDFDGHDDFNHDDTSSDHSSFDL